MIRLYFQLSDFTRLMWVSQDERTLWEPKIKRILKEWENVEYLSVKEGLRNGAIQSHGIDAFLALQKRAASDGLIVYTLAIHGESPLYAATPAEYTGGAPLFRVAILHPDFVSKFSTATIEKDDLEIGRILGYPECCSKFFEKYWVEEKWVDTTYPMAQGKQHFKIPPENNILLRWLGVRLVPHLPCSFYCQWTQALALQLESLWNQEILQDAKEMLSWPIEWSALHGIAEIKTPVLKISTRTDATAEKHIVTVNTDLVNTDLFLLNGFKDAQGMEIAHGVVLATALQVKGIKTVMDLGCGNGYLLEKLRLTRDLQNAYGVDIDPDAINFGREKFPDLQLFQNNLFDFCLEESGARYDLTILMPGRIEEQSDLESREKLLRWLQGTSTYILLYGYDDWSWLIPRLSQRFFNHTWEQISGIDSRRATTVLLGAR